MSREEISTVLGILKISYPRFYVNMTVKEANDTVSLWQEMFNGTDINLLKMAVKSLITHFEFPPTIANIKKEIDKLTTPTSEQMTVDEAWGQVVKAIQNYGYNRQEEALNSMSPAVAKVAKNLYREFCLSENVMADRAHFMKMYEISQNRAKENRLIPLDIREAIDLLQEKLSMPDYNIQIEKKSTYKNYDVEDDDAYDEVKNEDNEEC